MSETQTPPAKPEPKGKPAPTVRSAATLAGLVVGAAVLVGLFAVGGPLVAAGGVAAATGAGYVRHRVKNPRRSTGRRKTMGGKLPWPLTGNQTRRALLPRGSAGKSGAGKSASGASGRKSSKWTLPRGKSTGPGRGSRGSGLTTRSRAKRSAGGALRPHKTSRPAPPRTGGRPARSAGKPKGVRAPKTPSRTPAKPGRASRLTTGSPSRRKPSVLRGSIRKAIRSGRKPSIQGRSSGPRPPNSAGRRTGNPLKLGGILRGGSQKSSASRPKRFNPLTRTSPSGKHSRTRNPFKRTTAIPGRRHGRTTSQAKRLGTPSRRPGMRGVGSSNRIPNRSARRPVPFKRATARRLLRQSIGLPNRRGKLPTPLQRRRDRRTLRLRGLTRLAASRRLPRLALAKLWDQQYRRVPQVPDPIWQIPTVPEPKLTTPAGPKHPVVASPTPEVRKMSVSESVSDAFSQLARFEASSAKEVEQLIAEQPEMFAAIGNEYNVLADRMVGEMPFDPAVADAMRDMAAAITAVGQTAEQVHEVMRQVHEADFARTETPRPNEDLWNPDRNQ